MLPFVYQVDMYFVNCYVVKMKYPRPVYIFKKIVSKIFGIFKKIYVYVIKFFLEESYFKEKLN